MFNYDLTIPQAKNILHELGTLSKPGKQKEVLYLSTYKVRVAPKTESALQKLSSLFASYVDTWTQDLATLPDLVNKIKELAEKTATERNRIEIDEVVQAINGLTVLHRHENFGNNQSLIASALSELIEIPHMIEEANTTSESATYQRDIEPKIQQARSILSNIFPQQVLNDESPEMAEIKKTMKEMFTDKELSRLKKIGQYEISSQFLHDLPRLNGITYKGQHLVDADKVVGTLVKKLDPDHGLILAQRLAKLMNQAVVGDFTVKASFAIPAEWSDPESDFSGMFLTAAKGQNLAFSIDENEQGRIQLDLRIVYAIQNVKWREGLPVDVGFIGLFRSMSFAKKELLDDLEHLPIEKQLPSMQMTQIVTRICTSSTEAKKNLFF